LQAFPAYSNAEANPSEALSGASYKGRLLAFTTNLRLDWKRKLRKQIFYNIGPRGLCYKNFCS